MSNSTYIEEKEREPQKTFAQQREERLLKERDQAYDFISELVEDDPSTLCEVVDKNYPDWCSNNCENFNRDCLKKFFAHYKKED